MNKKIKWLIIVIIVLLVAQLVVIRLVYSHNINGAPALSISKIYSLKAGTVKQGDDKLNIYLADYLENKNLVNVFISKQIDQAGDEVMADYQKPTDEEISSVVWDKVIKDAWLNNIAKKYSLLVTKEEIEDYLNNIDDLDYLKENAEKDFNLSFDDYQKLVIEPFILEAKVYEYLLTNYNDMEGVQRAQIAYEELEAGGNFLEVANKYSDDLIYVENSLWLNEEDLVDFYEPIKALELNQFTEIVIVPGAYIIWYLESITNDEGPIREVKGIILQAKTVDEFVADYLSNAEVKKRY